jgi:hypothetical protein
MTCGIAGHRGVLPQVLASQDMQKPSGCPWACACPARWQVANTGST